MERKDLLKILNGDISHINAVNVDEVALYEIRVEIKPQHVRKMLLDYLSNKINATGLTTWASFVCSRAEYGIVNYLDDDKVNYYEDMFYVIQRLSTPEIDGEVNEASVKSYLVELDKYFLRK